MEALAQVLKVQSVNVLRSSGRDMTKLKCEYERIFALIQKIYGDLDASQKISLRAKDAPELQGNPTMEAREL